MKLFLSCLLFALLLATPFAQVPYSPTYPRWLKNSTTNSDQTSGITYLRTTGSTKEFLLADDTGFLRRLLITDDTVFTIRTLVLSPDVQTYLKDFPKKDFEEISYDRQTGKIYLSIEGNNPDFKKYVGIYEITFADNSIYNDTIVSLSKLAIEPNEEFLRYTDNNIGFEGFTMDHNYFYAGLEGFQTGRQFADSTLLYIIGKQDLEIKKTISTRSLGIHTMCGLCAIGDGKLLVMDRNNAKLSYIEIDNDLNAKYISGIAIPPAIPGYRNLPYIASLESVTMDDQKNIYLVDDPWKSMFSPIKEILNQLDAVTQNNFHEYIPVIYKLNFQQLVIGK